MDSQSSKNRQEKKVYLLMSVGNVSVSTSDGQKFYHTLWERHPANLRELSPAIERSVRNVFDGAVDPSVGKSSVERWYQYRNELNFYGFRSDEFITDHSDKYHVIFIGDSNTFGEGLNIDETWAKLLYNDINSVRECSGFFNLGMPGKSNRDIVSNIFKYSSMFGKPDAIFINLTELNRFYALDNADKTIRTSRFLEGNYEVLKFATFDYYFMLEQYCLSNDIKLISFSWDDGQHKFYDKKLGCLSEFMEIHKFDTFISIDNKTINDWVARNKVASDPYWIRARDKKHYGTGYQVYWKTECFKKWNEMVEGE